MAEEAFALSPISARAALPNEADYDAIREAFMETARGRWFLSEYTKRNRNADTNMVLEAVTRMEANLAAQKQATGVVSLIESLGMIRAAVRDAKVVAAEAMPRFDDDGTLAAARNGARIIREIAWTLRECGADARICDLLDTQVQAIEAGQQRTANSDGRADVLASFDVLVQRIEQLATPDAPRAASPVTATEAPASASAEKPAASVTPLFRPTAETPVDISATVTQVPAEMSVLDEIAELAADVAAASIATVPVAAVPVEKPLAVSAPPLPETARAPSEQIVPVEIDAAPSEAETAADEAVLDMVAMEMGAADLSEPEVSIAEMEAPAALEEMQAPEPVVETSDAPSLGAALIANGVIGDPNAPTSDPLAPIRRMSQAEKIAFFS